MVVCQKVEEGFDGNRRHPTTLCAFFYLRFSSVVSQRTKVTLVQKVFRKPRPHHFNLCCFTDREEACCLAKVLDLLIFSSLPCCGPPQSFYFRIFYISHCLGPSDGNHSGQVFILLTDEKASTVYCNYQCVAKIRSENVDAWRGKGRLEKRVRMMRWCI